LYNNSLSSIIFLPIDRWSSLNKRKELNMYIFVLKWVQSLGVGGKKKTNSNLKSIGTKIRNSYFFLWFTNSNKSIKEYHTHDHRHWLMMNSSISRDDICYNWWHILHHICTNWYSTNSVKSRLFFFIDIIFDYTIIFFSFSLKFLLSESFLWWDTYHRMINRLLTTVIHHDFIRLKIPTMIIQSRKKNNDHSLKLEVSC
jgi:hypothetical protein